MIINIVKNSELFYGLKRYNEDILTFSKTWNYNKEEEEYSFKDRIISSWFNPNKVRRLGLSRTYPRQIPEIQNRPEYALYLHCSNYLPLFLINELYADRRDVLIEDMGGGMGWFFYYLNKLGFTNFHLWDNFSQLSEEAATEFLTNFSISCQINKKELKPVITNNVGVPAFVIREFQPELELICCYTNRDLESRAEMFKSSGYKFLCKDTDDLAFIYCRNDKYEEFKERLKEYEHI